MSKRKPTLSVEDRKAVDIVLDHAAKVGSSITTRVSADVSPDRIASVTKLLHLLNEMPAIDPPLDLVAKTMERINQDVASKTAGHSHINVPSNAHLY